MPLNDSQDSDRSAGSADFLKALAMGFLMGSAVAVFGHLQDPKHVVFTAEGLQQVVALFVSGGSTGAIAFLVGQNSGFKKGYQLVPPRDVSMRTRSTDPPGPPPAPSPAAPAEPRV